VSFVTVHVNVWVAEVVTEIFTGAIVTVMTGGGGGGATLMFAVADEAT
jgi:hypothetical protein